MIGTPELILILVLALFFLGPDKLPEFARTFGKAAGEFKKAQIEAEHEIKNMDKPMNDKEIKIHNLAIEMGLDAQNKTSEQLIEEIRKRIKTDKGLKNKMAG